MDRRTFLTTAAAGAAVLTARADEPPKPDAPKKGRMKVGHQNHSSDADLKVLAALGVQHIYSALPCASSTTHGPWRACRACATA